MNLKMKPGSSIREYVNHICSLENDLSSGNHSLHDSDKKHVLLNGLTKEFIIKKTILQEKYESSLEVTEEELKKIQTPSTLKLNPHS